jgi:hypothetical protein
LKGDGHAPAFKQGTDRRRGKPLSQGGKNASGDKNELSLIPRLFIHATILVRGKKENGSLTLPVFYVTPDGNLPYLIRGCLTTAGRDDFKALPINFCHNKQDNHKEILTGSCDKKRNPNIEIRNKSEIQIEKKPKHGWPRTQREI